MHRDSVRLKVAPVELIPLKEKAPQVIL